MSVPAEQIVPATSATPAATPSSAADQSAPSIPADRDDGDGLGNTDLQASIEDLFSGIADIDESDDSEEEVAVAGTGDEPPAVPAIVPATGDTPPEPAAATVPAESQVAAAVVTPAAEPAQATVPPDEGAGKTFEEMEAEIAEANRLSTAALAKANENRGKIIDTLADKHYGRYMTPEVIEQLRDDPHKVLPRLLATVYTDAVQGITTNLMQQLPRILNTTLRGQNLAQEAEAKMFEAFPMLKETKYHADISAYGKMYGKENPKATLADRIAHIGTAVCMKHKIAPPMAQAPVASAASVRRAGPAVPSTRGGSTQRKSQPQGNQFEVLSESLIDDDENL